MAPVDETSIRARPTFQQGHIYGACGAEPSDGTVHKCDSPVMCFAPSGAADDCSRDDFTDLKSLLSRHRLGNCKDLRFVCACVCL
jgi:hypothetical protein